MNHGKGYIPVPRTNKFCDECGTYIPNAIARVRFCSRKCKCKNKGRTYWKKIKADPVRMKRKRKVDRERMRIKRAKNRTGPYYPRYNRRKED